MSLVSLSTHSKLLSVFLSHLPPLLPSSESREGGEMEERELPSGGQLLKASSLSSLGNRLESTFFILCGRVFIFSISLLNVLNRSESMASVYSQGEGRYGTVTVRGEIEFGFIYSFGRYIGDLLTILWP